MLTLIVVLSDLHVIPLFRLHSHSFSVHLFYFSQSVVPGNPDVMAISAYDVIPFILSHLATCMLPALNGKDVAASVLTHFIVLSLLTVSYRFNFPSSCCFFYHLSFQLLVRFLSYPAEGLCPLGLLPNLTKEGIWGALRHRDG